jgi:hypothetical protein
MEKIIRQTALLFSVLISIHGLGQDAPRHLSTDTLTNSETDSLIIHYCFQLRETYFDPAKSKDLEKILRKKLKSGEFYRFPVQDLTNNLSLLLRELTHDNHFYVGLGPSEPAESVGETEITPEKVNHNGGFAEARLLENNVGYIKWTEFIADEVSFKKCIAALTFLQGCAYLIFDLSACPGGDGSMGGFMNQHLYKQPAYQDALLKKCGVADIWHPSEVVYNYTNGPTFYDIPVFIIVSKNTASAAEYFALIAQEMKRATILGATTAGAGNPSIFVFFDDYFAQIPVCEIRTVSGKSIEGKGVVPDVLLHTDNWIEETLEYIRQKK